MQRSSLTKRSVAGASGEANGSAYKAAFVFAEAEDNSSA